MPDIMGEYVDRLVTVEMRNRAMNPGITLPLYDAARKEGGGRPLSTRAAEGLVEHVRKGDNVFIITGAGTPPTLLNGESDGPPGAAALAHAFYYGIGATPIYICEQHHAGPIIASSEAVGVPVRDLVVTQENHWASAVLTAPTDDAAVPAWAADLVERLKPAAVISTERLGPNVKGIIHGATGLSGWKPMVDLSPVVLEATKKGVFTVGVGDAGNELGFGRILSAVQKINPYGEHCQCPCGAGAATVISTDVLVPAFISN
ncbi:MAG: glutamate cyclase domain-containing protein, partial [Chloroflexota bacterium]